MSFFLNEWQVLFFDIFYKHSKIYLILPIYNDPILEDAIQLMVDNKEMKISNKLIKNSYEPIMVYEYTYDTDKSEFEVTVTYNKITKSFTLKNKKETQHFLSITTLFKDDWSLFPIFYDYYRKQGVEHFYMYYNGKITPEIKQIVSGNDVTLLEWDFVYWTINCKFKHHAQLGQIHHALYHHDTKYMIFCDLDEYLYIPDVTLRKFIQQKPSIDVFRFCNHWAKTVEPIKKETQLPKEFFSSEKTHHIQRAKNIYKTSSVQLLGIHCPCKVMNVSKPEQILNLTMYHFYNWTQKERSPPTPNKTKIQY